MIIFVSILTTIKTSSISWGSFCSSKNWLELKIEQPFANLACTLCENATHCGKHVLKLMCQLAIKGQLIITSKCTLSYVTWVLASTRWWRPSDCLSIRRQWWMMIRYPEGSISNCTKSGKERKRYESDIFRIISTTLLSTFLNSN
jgi:hypothetical protein